MADRPVAVPPALTAPGSTLGVEFLQLDRRRELPIDQPPEICDHPVHEFPDRPKRARLARQAGVVGIPGTPREPPRLGGVRLVDGVGEDDVADQAKQRFKRGGGCGPLLEGLAHLPGHTEGSELTHRRRRHSPAAPRPLP